MGAGGAGGVGILMSWVEKYRKINNRGGGGGGKIIWDARVDD